MSEYKVYRRKLNNLKFVGSTEKEDDKKEMDVWKNWNPKTPASKDVLKFYTKRSHKDNRHELKDQISSGLETPALNSDDLIDLNKGMADLEPSSSKDSEELLERSIIGLPTEDHTEFASSIVKSFQDSGKEGDFGLGEIINHLEDTKAQISTATRKLDFSVAGDSNKLCSSATTHNEEQSSSHGSSNTPIEGAINGEIDTTLCLSLDLENNTISHECHVTQLENEKVSSEEHFEPSTPLKQNSKKRSIDGADFNQRAPKRAKIKKRRHRPKVAGEGRKRKVKISVEKEKGERARKTHRQEKEKKKYMRKPQPKEKDKKEKRKYVRSSLKASTTEHHNESIDAKLCLVNQQNDENSMKGKQYNVEVAPEVAVRGDQERDDQIMVLNVSTVSEHTASQCRNESVTDLWNLNFEMELPVLGGNQMMKSPLQPDVGANEMKLPCQLDVWPFSAKRSRSRKFKSSCHNRELSFPKGCKRSRTKRKGKSKLSVLMSFHGLKSYSRRRQRKKRNTIKGYWTSPVTFTKLNIVRGFFLEDFAPERSISSLTCDLRLSIPLPETDLSLLRKPVMNDLLSGHSGQLYLEDEKGADQQFVPHKMDFLTTPLENVGIHDQNLFDMYINHNRSYHMNPTIQIGSSVESKQFLPITNKSRGTKKAFNNRKRKNISIDDITRDLELLKICDLNAISPYQVHAIVPHKRPERKLRAQVVLDKETLRQWNLLMKIDDGLSDGQEDKERDKKWQEDLEIFHGRTKSFTSRMHTILGDRRFKPWKGSVVDSVVGVFLTQNVTDLLSSSAYMSLASKFPIRSTSNQEISDDELDYKNSQEIIVNNSGTYFVTEPKTNLVGIESTRISSSSSACHHHMEDCVTLQETIQRPSVAPAEIRKVTNGKKNLAKREKSYWNNLGKTFMRPRSRAETDSVDWEAVRQAPEVNIADAIKSRGQHNIMAKKIKKVLNRIVDYHGSIDLEWLRYAPEDDGKKYLLEIEGLGLKSVECLRLLELYHNAFPVDTNVARIAVRLGWVPLEPLPGNLQLHLLEEYPIMDSIQKYLWPRLSKLDQKALYELHYQMITFGKVFCSKLNPNCGACPMRAECRHLASAIASENLCLPGPSKKGEERTQVPSIALENSAVIGDNTLIVNQTAVSVSEFLKNSESEFRYHPCEPIIEEPESPERIDDIEDFGIDYGIDEDVINDEEEIPTIKLSNEPFRENVQYFMDMYQNDLQTDSSSRALVPLSVNLDSVPVRKLKNISRLRTEHQVYELPDYHELLIGQRKRDRNDQSPYLLAIWSPGETPGSCQPPKKTCNSQASELCEDPTCSSCQRILEERFGTVRGTILVPCRTAMRGRFPLNGTYFQVNEVFADHESSYNPMIVPRSSIWHLRRRTVYFGTSPNAIFKACSIKEIQENFWKGFICVRGWEAKTGAPKPLAKRFHCSPSKMEKTRKRVTKSSKEVAKDSTNLSHVAA